jgi:hypothetical protein
MAETFHPLLPLPQPIHQNSSMASPLIQSLSSTLSLQTLPIHIHKTLTALFLFQLIYKHIAPQISTLLFPKTYTSLSSSDRSDWNMRVVSLTQSSIISVFSTYLLISNHSARSNRDWVSRIYSYDSSEGHLLSIAVGYFAWHLPVTVIHRRRYGWGMVAHGVICFFCFSTSYVCIFSASPVLPIMLFSTYQPQRPFASHYVPVFLLYEASNIFLNFYRFFSKLNMVTSTPSIINAVLLIATFFIVRLVWGSYQTAAMYRDIWSAYTSSLSPGLVRSPVPLWLALWTMGANGVLCCLNVFWFGKIVSTMVQKLSRKRAE